MLVVEDDREVLALTVAVLERAGAKAVGTRDAKEAVKTLARHRFSAAVVDWHLGASQADPVLAAINADPSGLIDRTVLITADLLGRTSSRDVGRYGCKVLPKPFRPSLLVATLHGLLSRARPS